MQFDPLGGAIAALGDIQKAFHFDRLGNRTQRLLQPDGHGSARLATSDHDQPIEARKVHPLITQPKLTFVPTHKIFDKLIAKDRVHTGIPDGDRIFSKLLCGTACHDGAPFFKISRHLPDCST